MAVSETITLDPQLAAQFLAAWTATDENPDDGDAHWQAMVAAWALYQGMKQAAAT